MSRRRFFVDEVRNGQASISGEDAKHLTRVLRVERGEWYEIADGEGKIYLAEITLAHKGEVAFEIREAVEPKPVLVRITLMPALFKFDHFEWMLEKATELGVERVSPLIAIRSERGLEQAAGKRIERWRRIAMEASQQSRRDRVPVVDLPIKLQAGLRARGLVLDEEGGDPLLNVLPESRQSGAEVVLALGPEGGWTPEERAQFAAAGWTRATLGAQILRAETAAIAGLAIVQAAWTGSTIK
jgi:16S rRNA (uracil1498-N3)-methyltransferase